jgi:FlaG/FlaF family flagellin (archaellin)
MFFALHPNINRMRSRPDSAISEIIATTLIIVLVVALAAIIAVLVLGIPLLPEKPVLAAFSADTVMGRGSSGPNTVPVIRLYQMAGAPLIQDYTEYHHSAINGTKVKLVSPDGKTLTAVKADSLQGKTVEKGEPFYIFYYNTGGSEYPWIWITNDPARVFNSNVQPLLPHGTWKLMVTEEKDTNMIIYQKDIKL